ncbi:MAG: LysM peptidoglycan-binding domain-containing protein [Chloroflexota bacterium]
MIRKRIPRLLPVLWLTLCLALSALACSQSSGPVIYVTATVSTAVPSGEAPLPNPFRPTPTPSGPTATPIQPTPNPTYPPSSLTSTYTVQAGDTLDTIAQSYGISIDQILSLNSSLNITTPIFVGQVLTMPNRPSKTTLNFKIIPDSELINSPAASKFDLFSYIKFQPGFIRVYSEDVYGRSLSGTEIVQFVSLSTSINPRLLLALLEYKGGWVSNPVPDSDAMTYPMGLKKTDQQGLFKQLFWAANELNSGYYGWKYRGITSLKFSDQSRLAFAPELNPATVAVQYLLSESADRNTWQEQIKPSGFFTTYMAMFGDPFLHAIEPLVPTDIKQPEFQLPFPPGETWYFTGGPHGGWDANSGWAGVDFAPPKPPDDLVAAQGNCYISPSYALAIVGGLVTRSGDGAVVIDVDMDGDERTGWTVLYLHIADQDRIKAGTVVKPGTPIGHPSCQGFYLNAVATHLHIARRYNGEWIAVDCWACAPSVATPPLVMGGWTFKGYANQIYQGWMEKDGQIRRAEQGRDNPDNQVSS